VTSDLRGLLEGERLGVLSTLSARRGGWPFASLAPYALSERGEPLLLLSDLAEHTRNIRADSRASLLVHDSEALEDPQAGARLTVLGKVEPLTGSDLVRARSLYLEKHPQADAYFAMADFKLYVLRVNEARFINGFGDMGWITADRLQKELAT
jgi:heme iron utilization protein